MKKIHLFLLLFVFIFNADAQFNKTTLFYGSVNVNGGNYFGIDLNVNYIYKDNYSFKIGYSGFIREAKNLPYDFDKGTDFFARKPIDILENYYFLVGKLIYINNKKIIRTNLSFGLGYSISQKPIDWKKRSPLFFSNRNYTWNHDRQEAISLIINPKIEYLATNAFGVSFSPLIEISKDETYYGAGIGVLFRIVKNKKKK